MTEYTTPTEVTTIQGIEVVFSRRSRVEVGLEVLRFLDQQNRRSHDLEILDLSHLSLFETARIPQPMSQVSQLA